MRFLLLCLTLLFGSVPVQAAVILQYHHIGSDSPAITSTTIAAFEQHLEYLENSGLRVVPLADIVTNPGPQIDNRVAITFDDAYDNIYQHAVPRLKAKGWPFSLFVATEYIEYNGYMTWEQLQDAEASGGSVANHTHSHLHLLRRLDGESKKSWLERIKKDIQKAQSLLKQHLKQPPKYLAYPYGEYDDDILNLITKMGYTAFGQQSGAVGSQSIASMLPRYPLSGAYEDLETFKTKVHTQALPVNVPTRTPLIKSNPPALLLEFPPSIELAFDQLNCYGPGGKASLNEVSPGHFEAINLLPLPVGRSRYNCTMPTGRAGEFYWFSQLWILKNPDGSWYPEH
ncbi:MAG: biofilm PGA synthesis lipoprotein PgaB [Patiriisocius sp.]|jgi:biofilm PGA synthesis lipoprotein PgaB